MHKIAEKNIPRTGQDRERFLTIKDPGKSTQIRYLLFDVLFLTLCAVIAGCRH